MNKELTSKQLAYLTDLEERDKCAKALYGKMEINNTAMPVFDQWTLIDAESCRIYAVFSNPDDIAAYITNPLFPTMMEKIIRDRQLSVYDPSEERIVRVKLNPYASIKLIKSNIEVWISGTVDGAPIHWTIGETSSQWMHAEVTTEKLLETKFDLDTMRRIVANADFAF